MKTIICSLVLGTLLFTTSVFAQEYKISTENSRDGKLTLDNFMGSLPIEGYDGKEIIVTLTSSDSDKNNILPERAKGLKPINGGGIDNTGIGICMEKNGNQVTLTCIMPITKQREYKVQVPFNFSLKVKSGCERSNDVSVNNMKNEIEIVNCQSIKLKNVTGSMILSTISGNIDLEKCALDKDATISMAVISGNINASFIDVSTKNPVSFNCISGDVDITIPAKTAVNLKMKSISGKVYSDFDFPDEGKKMKQVGGTKLENSLNGGGVDFNISTISGNIYLRKGK